MQRLRLAPPAAAGWHARPLLALLLWLVLPAQVSALTLGCLITPARVAEIGTPQAGVVDQMLVDRGDSVRQGQPLALLQAAGERASVRTADARAKAQAAVSAAQATLALARQKAQRAESLHTEQFISDIALDQARTELSVAGQALKQAEDQRAVYQAESAQALAQLNQRALRSPFDGVVIDRMAQPGERVELQPLLRIADVARLRVEVVVPASQFGQVRTGARHAVKAEVPGVPAREATVTQVDQVIDAASNTFRVRLALDNADRAVPAGARCQIDLGLKSP
ncbi:efflux RND transporter periplasmic adaptor subunit [Sphaerotilus sp.]|uniref:efflux RND transporter periplasmic adaptor subunit n=1 Tax=Sphaerotilus sp. TaxID=2093942 RepID=UPI00286E85BC|nr:efflux RND transporter periplasmic adaptor subunit [Sphaerotilus sp.]